MRKHLKLMLHYGVQAIVLPWASVIVIIVLLKLALTCAVPEVMFLRSRRLRRGAVVDFAIQLFRLCAAGGRALFLLAGDRTRRPLARTRVGMGALAAHRQAAAVSEATIAAE